MKPPAPYRAPPGRADSTAPVPVTKRSQGSRLQAVAQATTALADSDLGAARRPAGWPIRGTPRPSPRPAPARSRLRPPSTCTVTGAGASATDRDTEAAVALRVFPATRLPSVRPRPAPPSRRPVRTRPASDRLRPWPRPAQHAGQPCRACDQCVCEYLLNAGGLSLGDVG